MFVDVGLWHYLRYSGRGGMRYAWVFGFIGSND